MRYAMLGGLMAFAASFYGAVQTAPAAGTSARQMSEGQQIFRFDTFGDEQLWTGVLRMHEALPSVDPTTALSVGLKVDAEALPAELVAAIKAGKVDLKSPAVTIELLKLNAVVGVIGKVNPEGKLSSVGITCALCHSTVDNSFAAGIGKRLDGWPNRDLNVGAILGLAPGLDAALKAEFAKWGPGKYDPRHHAFDGKKLIPLNSPSLPVLIPPAFGLQGVGFETYTGDGPISYWNAYVGIGQMGGQGTFSDPRIGLNIVQKPDLVTSKLPALLQYQLSLQAPAPPAGSFDAAAASRGEGLFNGKAQCASCHPAPTFTGVGTGPSPVLHAAKTGTEALYAARSATKQYRATPLRGAWQHPPYFHDGSAADLLAVVNHYDRVRKLNLSPAQKADLVAFLKSL
jgi:hypothetical protein